MKASIILRLGLFALLAIWAGCHQGRGNEPTKVERVDLSGQGLSQIPDSVIANMHLVVLEIRDNRIQSFEGLENHRNLSRIIATGNNIRTLESSICKLQSLRYLDLCCNNPSYSNRPFIVPRCLFELPSLDSLILESNHDMEFPQITSQSNNLKFLDMSEMGLDSVDVGFFNFPNLKFLDLRRNELISLPKDISKLTGLEALVLDYNRLKSLPVGIGRLPNLASLSLAHNPELNQLPKMRELQNLRKLDLSHTGFGSFPMEVLDLAQLESLKFISVNIGAIPLQLNEMTNLKSLELAGCKVNSLDPASFQTIPIRYIGLEGNPIKDIDDEILQIPTLKTLILKNTLIPPKRIAAIIKKYPLLRIQ